MKKITLACLVLTACDPVPNPLYEVPRSINNPTCVIWKFVDWPKVEKYPVIDLDYGLEICEHVSTLLNNDEYMTGNKPRFSCVCK